MLESSNISNAYSGVFWQKHQNTKRPTKRPTKNKNYYVDELKALEALGHVCKSKFFDILKMKSSLDGYKIVPLLKEIAPNFEKVELFAWWRQEAYRTNQAIFAGMEICTRKIAYRLIIFSLISLRNLDRRRNLLQFQHSQPHGNV